MVRLKNNGQSDAEIARKVVLKERILSANFNAQGMPENKAFLEKSLRALEDMPSGSIDWCLTFLAVVSLLTGRSLEHLIDLGFVEGPKVKQWWLLVNHEAWICYRPDIIRDNMENTLGDVSLRLLVNVTKTTYFAQPIPRSLTKHLLVWCKVCVSMRKESSLKKPRLPKALQEYDLRPHAFGRIASALTYYLATKRIGVAEIAYLTGLSSRRCVALYYSQLQSNNILPPYIEYLLDLGFPADEIPKTPVVTVGSALTVNEQYLSKVYSDQVRPLHGALGKDVEDYIRLHNEIVYMVWIYIQLSTAHRHNVTTLKTVLHFDLKSGLLVVEDKTSRPLVLSKSMHDQLKCYLNYLQNFLFAAERPYPKLATLIKASLHGTAPLLFLVGRDAKRKVFSTENLEKIVSNYWTLPPNWARHYTLTKLVTQLPSDQFPGFAGHLEGEKEVDDQFSCLSPSLQKQASDAMEKVLDELGIKPLDPCLYKQPSPNDTPLRIARSKAAKWRGLEKERLEKDPESKAETNSKIYWNLDKLQRCSSLWKWEDRFEACLGQLSVESSSQQAWVAMILYSAMTRGGLTKPEMLYDLYRQLWSGDLRWWTVADRCYVDLRYQVGKGPYNVREYSRRGERSYRQLHWPIDAQTLCLLLSWPCQQYLKKDHVLFGEGELAEWLSGWFMDSQQSDFKSLRMLCRSIPFIQWFHLKADISYAEVHIAGPLQPNFAPNKVSLISLEVAPKRIDWQSLEQRAVKYEDDSNGRIWKRSKSEFSKFATDLIQSTLSPESMNQREAKDKLSDLMNMTEREWPLECRIFLEWLQFKLDAIKVISAKSYVSSIAREWFTAVKGHSFEELDANAILNIYEGIVSGTDNTSKQQTYIARLRWLHQFGVEVYGWPINKKLTKFLKSSKSLTFVRTSIVDYRHVYNVLEAIDKLGEAEIHRAQLKLILIFGFRCGLRVGEILKLRFRDVDPKSGWAVYVRGSRHGSNKSDNALRRLELASLFTADELGLMKQYYQKLSLTSDRGDLLFGLDGENIHLDQIAVSQKLGRALRQSTDNQEIVFHSLRHSCATHIWTILSKEWQLAQKLTGYGEQKLASVRWYWMLGDELVRDALWQMARGLGHAGPKTSAQTYLHLIMETVHQKLVRAVWSKESFQKSLKRFGNFRAGELRKKGYEGTMTTFSKRVHERVRLSLQEKRLHAAKRREFKPNLTFDLPETYLILADALQKLEAGQIVTDIALQYPIAAENLESIECRCRKLANMTTAKGGSKFVSQEASASRKSRSTAQEALIPKLHNSPDVLRLVIKISNILRQKCQKKRARKAIVQQAMAVLRAFTISKHYLLIKGKEDLSAILEFCQEVIPPEYWNMKVTVLAKRQEEKINERRREAYDYWAPSLIEKLVRGTINVERADKKSSNRYGILHATLAHSKESTAFTKDSRNHGVKMLGWLAYMTVVLYGTNEEVEVFSEMAF